MVGFPSLEAAILIADIRDIEDHFSRGKHSVECASIKDSFPKVLEQSHFYLTLRNELESLKNRVHLFKESVNEVFNTDIVKDQLLKNVSVPGNLVEGLVKECEARYRVISGTCEQKERTGYNLGYKERLDSLNSLVEGLQEAKTYYDVLSLSNLLEKTLGTTVTDFGVKCSYNNYPGYWIKYTSNNFIQECKKINEFAKEYVKIEYKIGYSNAVNELKDFYAPPEKSWLGRMFS